MHGPVQPDRRHLGDPTSLSGLTRPLPSVTVVFRRGLKHIAASTVHNDWAVSHLGPRDDAVVPYGVHRSMRDVRRNNRNG